MVKRLENEKQAKNLMKLSLYAGQLLIQNGAEAYRAEDTVQRICNSVVNVSHVDAYALPSAIFLSLEYEGEMYTVFRKINITGTNLTKIDQVNSFSRDFVKYNMEIHEGFEVLQQIDDKCFVSWKSHVAAAVAASLFCVLFGGDAKDFLSAFMIGFSLSFLLNAISQLHLPFFIDNFIGAFYSAFMAFVAVNSNIGSNIDNITIGVIMLLVPGVAITNSMRDIMSGEFITGIITLTKAIFIALAIALGVGSVLSLRGIV